MQYARQYFTYILDMCLDFFIFSGYSHYLTCIFLHLHVYAYWCVFDWRTASEAVMHLLVSTLHSLLYIAWCGVRLSTHLSRVRSHWHTRYGTVMACRVCLTVSSLLPTDGFIFMATNCRCFQPAYFPGLHRWGKRLCVSHVAVDGVVCASWRECVYHVYVYGNTAHEVRT